ncbi:C-1-tetrahydrofolate synthase, cytoplasmic-like [Penaeus monodon]|uniref:C-1-tetrahydrofolate synthase, cytoplasmic-like n=1 Tax=Penaeus monodon TaxID=6687 RepID=UPI0018A73461|nr:C-1-tetrahydrofolate synthase, cytoplasmic-like [Penaeus monodon]
MRERLGRMVVASDTSGNPVQQLRILLVGMIGFCVTEAGFGADIGMEKFFQYQVPLLWLVQCSSFGGTVRSLKNAMVAVQQSPWSSTSWQPIQMNTWSLLKGFSNLGKQIENGRMLWRSSSRCNQCVCNVPLMQSFATIGAKGGSGAVHLAEAVLSKLPSHPSYFKFPDTILELPIEEKIRTLASEDYVADECWIKPEAQDRLIAKDAGVLLYQSYLLISPQQFTTSLAVCHIPDISM